MPAEYFDYADIFSLDLTIKMPDNTGINKNAIKLVKGKWLLYGFIYTFNLIELKTLKAYIKTPLQIEFI